METEQETVAELRGGIQGTELDEARGGECTSMEPPER